MKNNKGTNKKIDARTHMHRIVNKACVMGWSTKKVHEKIDQIFDEYGLCLKKEKESVKRGK